MARDLRIIRLGAIYHVTNRCYNDEFRLLPGPIVNMFVASCLAMAARRYGVQVVNFMVMGNHFHLLLQVPFANLNRFMEYFQKELSHRLNRLRGRRHSNFPERYTNEEVGSARDFLRVFARIMTNPQRAGLVYSLENWRGASSLGAHRAGDGVVSTVVTRRTDATLIRERGLAAWKAREGARAEPIELQLSAPHFWRDEDPVEVQRRLSSIVDLAEAQLQTEMDNGELELCDTTDDECYHGRPENVQWRQYRRFISSDPERCKAFDRYHRRATVRHRRAARRWRRFGQWGDYPPGSFPPGWLRCLPPTDADGPALAWNPPRRDTG